MTETLAPISPEAYVKQVLPLTAPLWANGRAFDAYAAQTLELARTPYGKRNYSTLGFRVNRTIVSSFKRYERMARLGTQRLASIGIGATFPKRNTSLSRSSILTFSRRTKTRSG